MLVTAVIMVNTVASPVTQTALAHGKQELHLT